MNASGRRCRQFKNGFRHLAKICGGSFAGGRRVYKSTSGGSVADAIARERAVARRMASIKAKSKKG
jgi:hypothetical protein